MTDTKLGIVVPGSVVGPVGSGVVVAPTVQLLSVILIKRRRKKYKIVPLSPSPHLITMPINDKIVPVVDSVTITKP